MWKVMSFLVQNSTFGNDQSWPDTCFRRREGSNLGGNRTLGASRPAKIGSQHGSVLGCFLHCGGHKIWNLLILHVSTCQMSTLSQDMPSFRSLCAEDMSENWSHEICQSTSQKRCENTCQKTLRSCCMIGMVLRQYVDNSTVEDRVSSELENLRCWSAFRRHPQVYKSA